MMTENKKNQEFKSEKLNGILSAVVIMSKNAYAFCRFLCCRIAFMARYACYFSAGIDSWKADPELNNFRYM